MPEVRPIDANAAADKIMHEVEVHADEIGIGAVAIMIAFARALRDETDFPTIEPEVRQGRWIEDQMDLICSVCKWKYSDELPFMSNHGLDSMTEAFARCPHCGSKLRTPTEAQLDEADSVMTGGADDD